MKEAFLSINNGFRPTRKGIAINVAVEIFINFSEELFFGTLFESSLWQFNLWLIVGSQRERAKMNEESLA